MCYWMKLQLYLLTRICSGTMLTAQYHTIIQTIYEYTLAIKHHTHSFWLTLYSLSAQSNSQKQSIKNTPT